jgi:hypothetical protein
MSMPYMTAIFLSRGLCFWLDISAENSQKDAGIMLGGPVEAACTGWGHIPQGPLFRMRREEKEYGL